MTNGPNPLKSVPQGHKREPAGVIVIMWTFYDFDPKKSPRDCWHVDCGCFMFVFDRRNSPRDFEHMDDLCFFSIKHDLARSCFQLWPKIGDEGDKFSKFPKF